MKQSILSFVAIAVSVYEALYPCSIINVEKSQIGSSTGAKGVCSNNGLPITCVFKEGDGAQCDGPSGGYTGIDLNALIFSACGCSIEEENDLTLKKQLDPK